MSIRKVQGLFRLSLILLVLGFASASAQTGNFYVSGGLGVGFPGGVSVPGLDIGGTAFGFGGNFGLRNLIVNDLDGRIGINIASATNVSLLSVTINALYRFSLPDEPASPLIPYAGGGFRLNSLTVSVAGLSVSTSWSGLGVVGGAEYAFTEQLSAFGELNLDVVRGIYPNILFGVNYNF